MPGNLTSKLWDELLAPVRTDCRFVGFSRAEWEMFTLNEQKTLQAVARQLMNGDKVTLDDQALSVTRVGGGRLRMVQFKLSGREFEAIEQNPKKPSRWGQLAREKHQVVQFRDTVTRKYVAVAVDGEVREYGRYKVLRFRSRCTPLPAGRRSCRRCTVADPQGHAVSGRFRGCLHPPKGRVSLRRG
jgi:hypothetical protein